MMDRRSKLRTTLRRAGWCGIVAGALVIVAWVVSGWYGVAVSATGKEVVVVNRGCMSVEWARPGDAAYAAMGFRRFEVFPTATTGWRGDAMIGGPPLMGHRVMLFPLWWIAVPLGLVGAGMVRLGREFHVGLCPRCRYNLVGLAPGAPCPECGHARGAVA